MSDNNFTTNTQKQPKHTFSRQFSVMLSCSIVLTGLFSIVGIIFTIRNIVSHEWKENGITNFAWQILIYICALCCFIALIRIAVEERPFSKTLTLCMQIVGALLVVASVIFPRLPDYQFSGFAIFSNGNSIFCDGMILLPGLLISLFGSLIKEGFTMQTEIDEIV